MYGLSFLMESASSSALFKAGGWGGGGGGRRERAVGEGGVEKERRIKMTY